MRNETKTKRNETEPIETKRNRSKRNGTNRNETEQNETKPSRNETKPAETKRNKTKPNIKSISIELNGGKFSPRHIFPSTALRPIHVCTVRKKKYT